MRFVPHLAAAAVGMLMAVGAYTFLYAKGYSYITNDPAACANCHVMEDLTRVDEELAPGGGGLQ